MKRRLTTMDTRKRLLLQGAVGSFMRFDSAHPDYIKANVSEEKQ